MTALRYAAFFYPIYWSSLFCVHAGPVLLRIIFFRQRIQALRLLPLSVWALAGPVNASTRSPTEFAIPAALFTVLAVMIGAGIAFLLFRRNPPLRGLAWASLGQIAVPFSLSFLMLRASAGIETLLALVFYTAVFVVGIRRLASASPQAGYRHRLGFVSIAFLAPLGIFLLLAFRSQATGLLFTFGTAIVVAALACARLSAARFSHVPSLRSVAAALALSAALATVLSSLRHTGLRP